MILWRLLNYNQIVACVHHFTNLALHLIKCSWNSCTIHSWNSCTIHQSHNASGVTNRWMVRQGVFSLWLFRFSPVVGIHGVVERRSPVFACNQKNNHILLMKHGGPPAIERASFSTAYNRQPVTTTRFLHDVWKGWGGERAYLCVIKGRGGNNNVQGRTLRHQFVRLSYVYINLI